MEEELRVQVTRDYDQSSPKPPPPQTDQESPGDDDDDGEPARLEKPVRIVLPQEFHQRKQREAAVRNTVTEQQAVVAARTAAMGGGEKKQRPAVGRMRVARVLHSILTCGAAADGVDDASLRPMPRQGAGAVDDDDGNGLSRAPLCLPGIDGCGIR